MNRGSFFGAVEHDSGYNGGKATAYVCWDFESAGCVAVYPHGWHRAGEELTRRALDVYEQAKRLEAGEQIKVYDRLFTVVAKFTGPDYMADANAYMTEHRDTGLIAERDGTAYIALLKDKGAPAA